MAYPYIIHVTLKITNIINMFNLRLYFSVRSLHRYYIFCLPYNLPFLCYWNSLYSIIAFIILLNRYIYLICTYNSFFLSIFKYNLFFMDLINMRLSCFFKKQQRALPIHLSFLFYIRISSISSHAQSLFYTSHA